MISISGAENLEMNVDNVYASPTSFSLRKNKRMRVQGIIYVPSALSGVSGVMEQITGYTADPDYQDIFINGEYFGSGIIENMDFPPGIDVRISRPTVTISISEASNAANITGSVYFSSIFDIVTASGKYINSLSDSLTITRDNAFNQQLSYDFRIGFGNNSGITNAEYSNLADLLERNLFYNNFNTNFLYSQVSGLLDNTGVRFERKKRLDLINETLDYSRRYQFRDGTGCLQETFNHSVQLNENAIFTVSENYEGRYICGDSVSIYNPPDGTYERCSGISETYGLTGLKTGFISFQSTNDRIEKISSYSATYSNDQKPITGCLAIQYVDISFDYAKNIINRAYNNTFRGYGINSGERFFNAETCFLNYLGVTGFSTGVPIPDPILTGADELLIDKALSIANYQGVFTFNYNTTNKDIRLVITTGSGSAIDTYVIYKAPRLIAEQLVGYSVPSYKITVDLDMNRTGNWQAAYAICKSYAESGRPFDMPAGGSFSFSYPACRATFDREWRNYPIQLEV